MLIGQSAGVRHRRTERYGTKGVYGDQFPDGPGHRQSAGTEIQLFNRQLRVYASTKRGKSYMHGTIDGSNPIKIRDNVFPQDTGFYETDIGVYSNGLRLNWRDGDKTDDLRSSYLFSFNDDRHLYLGLNRAVGESTRFGEGLCAITISAQRNRGWIFE